MKPAKLKSFLETDGKKVLLYHTDTDGICSAALFMKFFGGYVPIPLEGPMIGDRLMKQLIELKPSMLVIVDIPLDQECKKLEKIQKESAGMKTLMIDHHIPEKDMNSERMIHINPRFETDLYIPASVLVYKLLKDIGKDVKSLIWIAATGVVGDYAYKDCKDIIEECEKTYPGSTGKDMISSVIGQISEGMMSTAVLKGLEGANKSLKIMIGAETYEDALTNDYFTSAREKVDREIKRILAGFPKKAKEYENLDLYIYKIDSRLSIASTISTKLASKHKDKMIFVIKHSKQMVKISARYQKGDINLNDLLKKAVEGIGSGGGHVKAAGAVVPRKDWKEFERRLLRMTEEIKATMVA